jgi:hypothetical protein
LASDRDVYGIHKAAEQARRAAEPYYIIQEASANIIREIGNLGHLVFSESRIFTHANADHYVEELERVKKHVLKLTSDLTREIQK